MKDFLYLFIGGAEHSAKLSPADQQRYMEKWYGWIGEMRKAGVYKAGNPLESGGKTLSGPKKVVTDGPFAESKEVVGGYIVVGVKDLDAAVEHARHCPIFEAGGRVEVRPIVPLELP